MADKVYALLIAIDKYLPPVPALGGCVQDSSEVQAYLEGTIPAEKLNLKVLRDEDATRENVIDAFMNHLTQADGDDSVFIHYSGHGSQEKTTPVFADLEPDGKNETLVLYDSRQTIDGVYHRDLADKELRALIHQVARKSPHIVGVFDCCHSGSNTRDTADVTKRQAGDDKAQARGLDSYVFMERSEFADTFQEQFSDGKLIGGDLPTGSHIALQGALSSQTAKELFIDGKKRGAFTYTLLKYLKESQGDITYGELIRKIAPYVGKKVAEQNPQLDVVFSLKTTGDKPDEDMVFLKGTLSPDDKNYNVYWDKKLGSWVVTAGQLNGVPATGTTRFAIYDSQANIEANPSDYLQVAGSKDVQSSFTTISIEGDVVLSQEATFKATILSLPITKTKVAFKAETDAQAAGVQTLKDAFELDTDAQKYLEVVDSGQEADYQVLVYEAGGNEKFGFYRPTDNKPLIDPLLGVNSRTAQDALKLLSGISRWDRTQTLENPTTKIPEGTLKMEVEAHHFDPQTDQLAKVEPIQPNSRGEIVIPFQVYGEMTDSSWGRTPVYKVKVKNNSPSQKFYVAVYFMGSNYLIQNIMMGQNIVGPGESLAVAGGSTMAPSVPEALLNRGIRQDTGYLKLVASTEPFDGALLEQTGFNYPSADRSLGGSDDVDSFSMLLEGQQTRALMLRKPKKVTDWTTSLISFTNIWDDDKAAETVVAKSSVNVTFPSGSEGKVRLSSLGHASRSVQGEIPGSIAMRGLPGTEPLELIKGQNASPGMEVIELEGLERSAVSAENPLVLTFDSDPEEKLVIVQEDEGILLPWISEINADGKPEIVLDRLPEPSTMERGIGSSIKLVVHKMLGGKLGVSEFPLPRLGLPSIVQKEYPFEFNYQVDDVKSAVASANRIMLLVHGFTSSCNETYFVGNKHFPQQSILPFLQKEGGYDLVLTFDYETLNTPITQTAKLLREKLAEVGLDANDDKELHIIAHSMGGLVSRTFIELQGGNQVVDHLVMAGTPNGGSPWVNIKQWALFGSTLLLNSLTGIGWGITALGYLFGAIKVADEFVEHNSDAMKPGSVFLQSLKNAADPGIPYTAIAGSTTMIPADADKKVSRIMQKLGIADPQFSALEKYLFKDENDLFVGVDSVLTIPGGRAKKINATTLPVNHFGFFVPDGGLAKLQELLLDIKNKRNEVDVDTGSTQGEDSGSADSSAPVSTDAGQTSTDPVDSEVKQEETRVEEPVKTETKVEANTSSETPVSDTEKQDDSSGGFWAWLKSLFGM